MKKKIAMFLVFCIMFFISQNVFAKKIKWNSVFKDVFKAVAVSAVIKEIAEPLNKFINNLLLTNHAQNKDFTKVVPIFSVGYKKAIGAAQVSGPKELVDEVKAVFCVEGRMHGKYRIKAYIPNNSSNPFKGINRVYGVGVTAIIDGFI